MITPLMYLLSGIAEDFTYDHPVDIMYLDREDRSVILTEARRIGAMANDENQVMVTEDCFGNAMVDTCQVINDRVVEITPTTAMLLNRVREAYVAFCKMESDQSTVDQGEDLGADAVILRLEGNPLYIYNYVYDIMKSRGTGYKEKILRIAELYSTILGSVQTVVDTGKQSFLYQRLEVQSTFQFWRSLAMADMMRHGLGAEVVVTNQDITVAKEQLSNLGFYGFVNPYKMYMDFSGARVNRKVSAKIDPLVTTFLEKVIRSGGVQIA